MIENPEKNRRQVCPQAIFVFGTEHSPRYGILVGHWTMDLG
jgi:hypothetical protein